MSRLNHAESFRDLIVYQKSRQLQREILKLTKSFPKEEMFSLTDQIRRSSRAIGANITEAWAKRRYEKHFISKLTDSDGEQMETQHWIETALECEYIDQQTSAQLIEKCLEIGRILNGMMDKAELFCGNPLRTLREESTKYLTESDSLEDTND
ncbi:MAG TPA: four helix bundle protein [Anaerolineales bacterium]|nr:four helix bundle protein [Anaerolineales bacterium]